MKRAATTLALCVGLYSSMLVAGEGQTAAAETTPAAATAPAPAAAASATQDTANADGSFASRETVCKNGKNVRKVKLGFADIKTGSDCKVSYMKETEEPSGAEKVLWTSKNDGKFCQQHAQGFVEKLKGQGWSCD